MGGSEFFCLMDKFPFILLEQFSSEAFTGSLSKNISQKSQLDMQIGAYVDGIVLCGNYSDRLRDSEIKIPHHFWQK